jgi:hypothetical protein
MRTIFVLSTLTGALIAGLNGSDVSFAFSFAAILAVAGLTRITSWVSPWIRATGEATSQPSPDHRCPLWCGWTATHGLVAGGGVA